MIRSNESIPRLPMPPLKAAAASGRPAPPATPPPLRLSLVRASRFTVLFKPRIRASSALIADIAARVSTFIALRRPRPLSVLLKLTAAVSIFLKRLSRVRRSPLFFTLI